MAETLGPYYLDKRIGSGGMADVFLAHGPHGLCVVKRPHRHLCANPDFVRMFLDEAALLAQLAHPGIARIFDLGQVQGVYYLAMEYVPGFDLMTISLEHERQGELIPFELCARLIADAADALHAAHEAKGRDGQPLHLIHRDVTPHNILLSTRGEVKLIDFGVAKAATATHRTQAGLVKGKYPYMAPEQVTGQAIDRRVDVYALGLCLYELLTNVRAIPGDSDVQQIDAARAARIRPVEQLRPNTPPTLRQVLSRCLAAQADQRYATAKELREGLEAFLLLDRHVVGREDLLRLFRVVAMEVAQLGPLPDGVELPSSRPTEPAQPAVDAPAPVSARAARPVPAPAAGPEAGEASWEVPALRRGPSRLVLALAAVAVVAVAAAVYVSLPGGGAPPAAGSAPSGGAVGLAAGASPAGAAQGGAPSGEAQPTGGGGAEGGGAARPAGAGGDEAGGGGDAGRPAGGGGESAGAAPPLGAARSDGAGDERAGAAAPRDGARPAGGGVEAASAQAGGGARLAVVTVTSEPEADVFVDAQRVGRAPLTLELSAGRYTVRLVNRAQGFTASRALAVKAGEQRALDVRGEKGRVEVRATPFAQLSVDGVAVAGAVSFKELELWEGPHTLELALPEAGKKVTRQVQVRAGATEVVEVNFLGP